MRDNNKNIEYLLVAILIVVFAFGVLIFSLIYAQNKELEILINAIGDNTGHIVDALNLDYE